MRLNLRLVKWTLGTVQLLQIAIVLVPCESSLACAHPAPGQERCGFLSALL